MPAPLRLSRSGRLPYPAPSLKLKAIAAALLLLLPLGTDAPRAIDENLTKGATNHHIFESGVWGENIDLLNGGLNLTIPIGPAYGVSADVSYQLKLAYSSKIWNIDQGSNDQAHPAYFQGNQHHRGRSRLQGRGQAGLGFLLQFGKYRLQANSVECLGNYESDSRLTEQVFEDSTGAVHPRQGDWRGSSDGSLMKIEPGEIRMPDGTRYILNHHVDDLLDPNNAAWPKCADTYPPPGTAQNATFDIYTNDYRGNYVTRIEGKDRVSGQAVNYAEIEYEPETAQGMQHLIKKVINYRNGVADTARQITFINTNDNPLNPSDPNKLAMGYIKSVTLPVFSDNPGVVEMATYTFNYTLEDIWDPWVASSDPNDPLAAQDNADDKFEKVLLLTSIDFPQGYQMNFEYTGNAWQGHNVGFLQARVLPTGARVEYEYQTYSFRPKSCTPGLTSRCPYIGNCTGGTSEPICPEGPPQGLTVGIGAKTVIPDPVGAGGTTYTWQYDRATHAVGRANPAAVVVTDPFGNDTVTYFHAETFDGSFVWDCPGPDNCVNEFNDIWKNGLSYKTEYYRGTYLNPGGLLRTEYQEWADDVTDPNDLTQLYHTGLGKRVVESGTIYNDDGGKRARTVNEEWDGLGNFRKTTEYGFDGLPYRITRTDYNKESDPNLPTCAGLSQAHCDNWILGSHTYSETLAPSGTLLRRSEFAFDGLGYLKAKKDVLTLPSAAGSALTPGDPNTGSAGDIRTEFNYEGDSTCPAGAASYATGNLCYKKVTDFGATSGVFDEAYTYKSVTLGGQTLVLPYMATRTLGSLPWKAEERDVDAGTGLTRTSTDSAGVRTMFDYDSLGRLVSVIPDSIADPNQIAELPASLSYPSIWETTLEQAISSSNKIYSKFVFDKLGRLISVEKRQSDGTTAMQKTQYDILGRITWQGEWGDASIIEGDPTHGTTFDYSSVLPGFSTPVTDPFGRVQAATTADGKVTRQTYAGVSSTTSVEGIQTSVSPAAFITAKTFFDRDAFGRLVRVQAPRTYNTSTSVCSYLASGADAFYDYDPLDRLVTVRLESQTDANNPSCPTSSQYRSFTYNALGRQLSATNPENGTVVNLQYDAVGNLLKRQDALTNVFSYQYDAASRLQKGWLDKAGPDPNLVILENIYGDPNTNASYGRSNGKLITVKSFDDTGQAVLQEELRYNGMNGRLSQVGRKYGKWDPAFSSITSQAELLMNYRYNPLGLLDQLIYPEKSGVARTVLSPRFFYSNGYLSADADPNFGAVSDPNRGVLVSSVSYNQAGGVRKIKTRGDVETDITPDSRNRPASITVTKIDSPSVTHFDSGAYTYDGAGNIASIGLDRFGYDAVGRLIRGFLVDPAIAGKTETLSWVYDPLGNMTKQVRETIASGGSPVTTTKQFVMNARNQIQFLSPSAAPVDPNSIPNVTYDGSGNQVRDPNYEYVFDARNRLTEVRTLTSGELITRYAYDGSGYRVSKYDAQAQMTTFYLRDTSGQTLSEFRRSNKPGAASWFKDYVYAAGRHVAMIENDVPAPPGGIEVLYVSSQGQLPAVGVSWEANSETDISHYRVTRTCCKFLMEPPDPLVADVYSTEYYDTDPYLQAGTEYTYSIAAIDAAGLVSAPSEPVVARPGDTSPPNGPTPLSAIPGDRRVTLSWSGPSGNADLWGYRVYRKLAAGSTWQNVGGLLRKPQTSIVDTTDLLNGTVYDYQVKAVDTAGLESVGVPATPIWRITPVDTVPPAAPHDLYAFAGSDHVDLYWTGVDPNDVAEYQVFRSTSPMQSADPNYLLAEPEGASWVDTVNVGPNAHLYYRVRALDASNNASPLSVQIEVTVRESASALPAPAISSNQSQFWGWDYCRNVADNSSYLGNCYLPEKQQQASNCSWEDPPGAGIGIQQMECPPWTHENSRDVRFSWTTADPNTDLLRFRVYGRIGTSGPWQLEAEYAEPSARCMRQTTQGSCSNNYDHYPLAFDENGPSGEFRYQDHAPDPDDFCQEKTYRVSAVAQVNGIERESVLSAAEVTVPKRLAPPENLLVGAEPFDSYGSVALDRFNPPFYGLTLSWSPGGSTCASHLRGYHVYRSRIVEGYTTDYAALPIRMTREPVVATSFRVEYLPVSGPDAYDQIPCGTVPPARVFEGSTGFNNYWCGGDSCAKKYAVAAVDVYGTQSGLSNQIMAFTDAEHSTNALEVSGGQSCSRGGPTALLLNTEHNGGVAGIMLPDPNTVAPPGPVIDPNWTWHFGPDIGTGSGQSDVGPGAGNWALVKWNLPVVDPNHGYANDFRLLRKRAGDPSYSEVTLSTGDHLDMIPGDDTGVRQFIWAMPLELACEDANYAIQSYDIYGNPGGITYLGATVPKKKLIPENFFVTGAGAVFVRTMWGDLPSCSAGGGSHYVSSYTVMMSPGSCSGAPPDPNTFVAHAGVGYGGLNDIMFLPPTQNGSYWYAVRANWSDGPSDMSPPQCKIGGGISAELLLPRNSPSDQRGDSVGVADGAIGTGAPGSTGLSISPHRVIGQSGGANPAVSLYFYHLDHLGTPRVITDVNGNVVSKHKYLPYGEELSPPPTTNTHMFTGHERDKETGLDYMIGRYFSPVGTFRFVSVDPGDDVDVENPQSWNPYSYVRNNPVTWIDPDGRKIVIKGDSGDPKKDKAYVKQVKKDLRALARSDPRLKKAIKELKKSATEHVIRPPKAGDPPAGTLTKETAQTTPTGSLTLYDASQPTTQEGTTFQPKEFLAHEVSHIEDAATGTVDPNPYPGSDPPIPTNEVKAIRMENLYRVAAESKIRDTWGTPPRDVPDPTKPPTNPWPK